MSLRIRPLLLLAALGLSVACGDKDDDSGDGACYSTYECEDGACTCTTEINGEETGVVGMDCASEEDCESDCVVCED